MSEFEQEEPVRPEFKGHPIKSFIDGKDMLFFPPEEYLDNVAGSGTVVGESPHDYVFILHLVWLLVYPMFPSSHPYHTLYFTRSFSIMFILLRIKHILI